MAERVDDAELSMNQLEALKDMAIDNIRKQAQVVSQVFTGKCRYCNEPIESGIYCDAECAQWHREEQAQNSVNMACDRQDLTDYVALY